MTVLIGLEHEYTVRRSGRPVDFARLVHTLGVDGVRADPCDPNAYRCTWGGVITADGREAEVAVPAVALGPGFTRTVDALAATGVANLRDRLPEGLELAGFSTHVSVSMSRWRDDALARRYARTFAAGLMLLMDRADSPGLLVRPRPGRLELCGEHVRGPHQRAAIAFAAGSTLAAARLPRRSERALAVDVEIVPAVDRYGWYVDRRAFGGDLYTDGRAAVLRRRAGTTVTAQEHLEATWALARAELVRAGASADVVDADAIVSGREVLPSEQRGDVVGTDDQGDGSWEPGTVGTLDLATRRRGPYTVDVRIVTWHFTVFRVTDGARTAFLCLPEAQIRPFLGTLDRGERDGELVRALAHPLRSRLSTPAQTREPGWYGEVAAPERLVPRERDVVTGRRLPSGGGGTGSGDRPGKERRSRNPRPRRHVWVGVAIAVAVIVLAAAAALALGGGDEGTAQAGPGGPGASGGAESTAGAGAPPAGGRAGGRAGALVGFYSGGTLASWSTDPPGGSAPTRPPSFEVRCDAQRCTVTHDIDNDTELMASGPARGPFVATGSAGPTGSECPGWTTTVSFSLRGVDVVERNGMRIPRRLVGEWRSALPLVQTAEWLCTGEQEAWNVDAS